MPSSRYTVLAAAVVSAALAPLVCRAGESFVSGARGLSAAAAIDFQVRVPRMLRLEDDQPRHFLIGEEDVERGYVRLAARVTVRSNLRTAPRLEAHVVTADFAAVDVRMESGESLSGSGIRIAATGDGVRVPVNYIIRLRAGAGPGTYAWPVALSLVEP